MAANITSLVELLQIKDLVYLFREFLHELKGGENLSFWLEVECYKRLRDEELMPRGREIWNKYFDPKSAYELNIEGRLKNELQANLRTPNRHAFEACQQSIWKLLEHDCFPKFLQSQKYKDYKGTAELWYIRSGTDNFLLFSFWFCGQHYEPVAT
jgi:hypothetical protein